MRPADLNRPRTSENQAQENPLNQFQRVDPDRGMSQHVSHHRPFRVTKAIPFQVYEPNHQKVTSATTQALNKNIKNKNTNNKKNNNTTTKLPQSQPDQEQTKAENLWGKLQLQHGNQTTTKERQTKESAKITVDLSHKRKEFDHQNKSGANPDRPQTLAS